MNPKHMRRIACLIVLFCAPSLLLFANKADSTSLPRRIQERNNVRGLYFLHYMNNPSLASRRFTSSLSDVAVVAETKKEEHPMWLHRGDGYRYGTLTASSYLAYKNRKHLWGNASYKNGKKENIRWNSTSDFERIYPYFLADTVGGNLNVQEYRFTGGYAAPYSSGGEFGIQVAYRAMQEYRAVDPRPRNIVSDFNFRGGISHTLLTNYKAAWGIHTNVYKQNSHIAFYNELGGVPEFLMTGLGSMFTRFRANKTEVYYSAKQIGTDIACVPIHLKGIYAAATYTYGDMERILSGHNNAPTNGYKEHRSNLHIGYLQQQYNTQWAVEASLSYRHRLGCDYILGDAAGSEYKVLDKLPQFSLEKIDAEVSFIYGQAKQNGFSWHVRPKARFASTDIFIAHPGKQYKNKIIDNGMTVRATWLKQKSFFSIFGMMAYQKNVTALLEAPKGLMEPFIVDYLQYTFEQQTADRYCFYVSPSMQWMLKDRLAWGISLHYTYMGIRNKNSSHLLSITTGITF